MAGLVAKLQAGGWLRQSVVSLKLTGWDRVVEKGAVQ